MIEDSPFGRIVIPERLPAGKALFYTTIDFDGRDLNDISGFLKQRFGIESSLFTCTQVHGATVVGVQRLLPAVRGEGGRRPDEGQSPTCDALWTADRHVALGIKVADCLPVTLMGSRVLANIHSGWRGTVQRITAITLDAIEREASFDPRASLAFLGPSIRVCCFEVGEEVARQFDARFVDRSHAKPHVDVVGHTAALLVDRGFAASNIVDSGLCTRCDGSIFHSYRREGKGGGRNLAIAAQ